MFQNPEKPLNLLLILNSLPGNHLILSPDAPKFTIIAVTDSYLEATYTQRQEIVGRGVFEALTDNIDNDRFVGAVNLSASLHGVLEQKVAHIMPDQRYDVFNPLIEDFEFKVWAPVNKPVFNEGGEIEYIIHTVEDITETESLREEKRLAYQKLLESESRFRRMVEQAPVAITLTRGPEVVIESINMPMVKFMNRNSVEGVIGKKMLEVLPELEGQPAYETVVNVQKTGIPFSANEVTVNLLQDGNLQPHYFNFSYTPVKNAGGIDGVLLVAINVTELVQSRKKLEESEASLQQRVAERTMDLEVKNAELEQFTYAASHDMQEPLRKITIYSNLLQQQDMQELGERSRLHLLKIEQSVKRMKLVIDDLLRYSHRSRIQEKFEAADLNKIIDEIRMDLDLLIEQKGAELTTDKLPVVHGVRNQLHQLFYNLLTNALKFSKPDVLPVIRIKVQSNPDLALIKEQFNHDKQFVQISVTDNGIGFLQEYSEQIFKLFKRLHGKTEYEGTGIGLALCKKIAENHGGTIWAESVPGIGATFHVLLPLYIEE